MKFENMDFCKIKKITTIQIAVVSIVLIAMGVYFSPNFIHKQYVMKAAKIKADSAIFTSRVLEEFAANKNAQPTEIAKKVSDELNAIERNPYNKKEPAYTFDTDCKGCSSIECDDKLAMVILSTYDKTGELVARTVIKPPSFVVYLKDDQVKTRSWFDKRK